jgi:phosphoribosylglycinamide formyltransferase 2
VVKPLMSSSGKGQSTVRSKEDLPKAWDAAFSKGRGDLAQVIVEGFIEFETEITLLTVTQKNGEIAFCPPIGHRQERGDYMESWLPCDISATELHHAQEMAWQVTKALGGAGIWGVEFFLAKDGVVFSELSPRPHDTGMVTLANCLPLNEFELHARAVLGLPIPPLEPLRYAASAVVLSDFESNTQPDVQGVEDALTDPHIDVRVFGKPSARVNRRMAVAVASGPLGTSSSDLRRAATEAAAKIKVVAK